MTWAADPNALFGSAAQASCVDPARAPRPCAERCMLSYVIAASVWVVQLVETFRPIALNQPNRCG